MDASFPEPGGQAWQWPRFVPAAATKILLAHLAVGFLQGSWVNVQFAMEQVAVPWTRPYLWELTGLFGAFCAFPIVLTAALNAPRPAGRWGRFLGLHLSGYALYALVVPAVFIGVRHLLYPLFGWGSYQYGPLSMKRPMEWLKLMIAYVAVTAGTMAWLNAQESRIRRGREAELREKLQEAQLQALSAQLDPHFLFNALNTVSSVMYEDLAKTDTLLASLAQMLRDGLEAGGPTWTLQRELQHLAAFLAFAEARFGDRLRVHQQVEAGLGNRQVPRFCVQRLVENALKHNQDDPGRALNLRVGIQSEDGQLRLAVEDNGGGFPDPGQALDGSGVGLRNLGEVLALQYGGRAQLEVTNLPAGGARVLLRIPKESADG